MTRDAWLTLGLVSLVLLAITPPLGAYLARVYGDDTAPGDRVFKPVERVIYRIIGVDETQEQSWKVYARSLLAFSLVSVVSLYLLQRLQGHLPLNPTEMNAVDPATAFNTAISFATNTNWQTYGGESTMSHLTQMAGLAVQNFVSAAVGIAVAIALVRGLVRRRSATIGNFWVDLVRSITRVLLPVALIFTVIFVSQGVVQNFTGGTEVSTLENSTQVIPGGPVASQEVIKVLGTNGGGFYNANSAHPFENPSAFTNLLQVFLMLLIPFALAHTFGQLARNKRQGWTVFVAMFALWAGSVIAVTVLEARGNTSLKSASAPQELIDQQPIDQSVAGNLEGKEMRIGTTGSGIFATTATGTSTGAANSAYDSYTPLGGGVILTNMMLGEVSPGGVGSGLYGILVMALLAVFIAGLMVGRTPEFLGKKIQASEMRLVVLYILAMPTLVLGFSAASVLLDSATSASPNSGPHGLTTIVYAFTSTANNNGSGFGGLTSSGNWYSTTLGVAMLAGRYLLIITVLAIAGALASKQPTPTTSGTFRTDTPLFTGLLVGVVIVVSGLTFLPTLSLGPIAEGLAP